MHVDPLFDFIWQQRTEDPHRLALRKAPEGWSAAHIAHQVDALQRLRHKVPSWYRPGLLFPPGVSVEQASSALTAQYKAALLADQVEETGQMADLTGGLGVDAFFFARHFGSVWHVEQGADISAAARHNFEVLGAGHIHCVNARAEEFLEKTAEHFDLVYLDPARRDGVGGRVFRLEDCQPNVLAIKDLVWRVSPRMLLKTAPLLDLSRAAEQLGQVARIWVVAAEGDCREVLYLLERDAPPTALADIPICAVHLMRDAGEPEFCFSLGQEREAEAPCSPVLRYLYEPHAAILKAGAFRSFAVRYGLHKLHPNTHLYTSSDWVPGVPARAFSIEAVCRYDRKAVAAAVPGGRAHVAVRNFPDSAEQVRKRLGLADGGDVYLFAATDTEGKKVVVASKVEVA